MSAPLKLTPDEVQDIASALKALSQIRIKNKVEIGGFGGQMEIRHVVGDAVLALEWDDAGGEYRIDDRVGS